MEAPVPFALRPLPFWSRGVAAWVLLHAAAALCVIHAWDPYRLELNLLYTFLFVAVPLQLTLHGSLAWLLASGLGGLLMRGVWRQRHPGAIVLDREHVSMPRMRLLGLRTRIAYTRLYAVDRTRRWGLERLYLGVERGLPIAISERWFRDATAIDRLADALIRAIETQPGGDRAVAAVRERAGMARLRRRPAPVTWILSVLLIAVFLVQLKVGAVCVTSGLAALGALVPALVFEGEWFRLVSGEFLHTSWPHLLSNLSVLLVLGHLLEPLVGSVRFGVLIGTTALLGGAAPLLPGASAVPLMSFAGASSVTFGLLGAFGFLHLRFRGQMPAGLRWPAWYWAYVAVQVLDEAFYEGIHPSHLAGFVVGATLCYATASGPLPSLRRRVGRGLQAASAALALVFAAGGFATIIHATTRGPSTYFAAAGRLLSDPALGWRARNAIAFYLAANPKTPVPLLEHALEAAERARSREPDEADLLDTVATLHYRLGHFREAVTHARELHERSPSPFSALQLARFEFARWKAGYREEHPARARAVGRRGAVRVELDRGTALGLGGLVRVLALHEGDLLGLIELHVREDAPPIDTFAARWLNGYPPEELTFALVSVDPGSGVDCEHPAHHFRLTSEVRSLP